jgi:chromosome segregation ATPase
MGFLGRFLWALVKVVLVLAVIVALGFGGYLGIRELGEAYLDLSAETVETASRVDLLRSDVNTLMANDTNNRRESSAVNNDLTALDGRISAVEREISVDLEQQSEQLSVLESRIDDMAGAGVVISDNVTLLNGGIGALQSDIVTLGSDLDTLGGEVDGLQSEVVGLGSDMAALQETLEDPLAATEDVEALRQTLALFRVWELVARARLRLLEDNPGLALADVQAAQAAVETILETAVEETAASLTPVQQRLDLAAASLPDDPLTAGRDLETAWESLDVYLGELLGLPVVESVEEGES